MRLAGKGFHLGLFILFLLYWLGVSLYLFLKQVKNHFSSMPISFDISDIFFSPFNISSAPISRRLSIKSSCNCLPKYGFECVLIKFSLV